jgi:plastocyanin
MIKAVNRKGIMLTGLFLSLYFCCCTQPGDRTLNDTQEIKTAATSQKPVPEIHTIEIENMQFQPAIVTVRIGDTIVWINKDIVAHCVTGLESNAWTSSKIPKGSSWKMVVSNSTDYYCAIHQVMKGKIVVE